MYRVRYYDEAFHPDHFKAGVRGWFIVALNWLRWKLETFIQKQVLRFVAKRGALPRDHVAEMLRSFRLDVKAEQLQKEQTSPLHESATPVVDTPADRASRYIEGAKRTFLDELEKDAGLPPRPVPLSNLIGQYGFDGNAKRYAKGRRYLVGNPDGDFETMEDDSGADGRAGDGGSGDHRRSGVSRRHALDSRPEVAADGGRRG